MSSVQFKFVYFFVGRFNMFNRPSLLLEKKKQSFKVQLVQLEKSETRNNKKK